MPQRQKQYQSNIERLSDTSFHDWYRTVYAYSDDIIYDLVAEWDVSTDDLILDPFVGTGTTVVAANKLGIDAIGTDALPPNVLATQAKSTWDIDLNTFLTRSNQLLDDIRPAFRALSRNEHDKTLADFTDNNNPVDLSEYDFSVSDKLPKGWLSEKPRKKMQVLKHEIDALPDDDVTRLLRVAMFAILPENVGNVGFGPEAYRTKQVDDVDVHNYFTNKIDRMYRDLEYVQQTGITPGESEAFEADARVIGDTLTQESGLLDEHGTVDYVITSPPYPAEHDYTRNQRLELVWTDAVTDTESLQHIKKNSIRSNTKNIYVGDNDGEQTRIRDIDAVDEIVAELERIVEDENIEHGFGQYYPRVIEEYFGGMTRHLQSLATVLRPGGKAGYVVADQASYWQVDVPTGDILSTIAEQKTPLEPVNVYEWRSVNATTGAHDELEEHILVLENTST